MPPRLASRQSVDRTLPSLPLPLSPAAKGEKERKKEEEEKEEAAAAAAAAAGGGGGVCRWGSN
jgi:hypothetical protein